MILTYGIQPLPEESVKYGSAFGLGVTIDGQERTVFMRMSPPLRGFAHRPLLLWTEAFAAAKRAAAHQKEATQATTHQAAQDEALEAARQTERQEAAAQEAEEQKTAAQAAARRLRPRGEQQKFRTRQTRRLRARRRRSRPNGERLIFFLKGIQYST